MAILISIQPQWVEKILNGEKTIEIRKTRPKCELPCKVYIYCTKTNKTNNEWTNGMVLGVDNYNRIRFCNYLEQKNTFNGKVVAEFTLNVVEDFACASDDFNYLVENTKCCLSLDEVREYCRGKDLYGWYIDDLVIYDEPKDYWEFRHIAKGHKQLNGKWSYVNCVVSRPPQSWCYVEDDVC